MKINPKSALPKFMQIYFNFSVSEARDFEKLSVTSYFYKKRNYKPILKSLSKLKKSKQKLIYRKNYAFLACVISCYHVCCTYVGEIGI